MPDLTLRGFSDDLIDVSGSISEEWDVAVDVFDTMAVVAFSDGTAARVEFDRDGVWRISTLRVGTGTEVKHTSAVVGDEECYSDILELTAGPMVEIEWAVCAPADRIAYASGSVR